jgi:hypothetical protein
MHIMNSFKDFFLISNSFLEKKSLEVYEIIKLTKLQWL